MEGERGADMPQHPLAGIDPWTLRLCGIRLNHQPTVAPQSQSELLNLLLGWVVKLITMHHTS